MVIPLKYQRQKLQNSSLPLFYSRVPASDHQIMHYNGESGNIYIYDYLDLGKN